MIRAIHFPDRGRWAEYRTPGSFIVLPYGSGGRAMLAAFCPCGCGRQFALLVGEGHKPGGDRPSWRWNGSLTEPTLDPSVNQVGHWHGWLRDGYWRQA